VTVDVQPPAAQVVTGKGLQLTATVTGTADTSVVWDVVDAGGGTVTQAGLYTAPGTAGTFHVRASSHAAPSVQGTSAITVTAPPPPPVVTIAIAPRTATVAASGTVTFSATVTGATNTGATYAVQETSGCGSITSAGVYTAPSAAATCHVVAQSTADTTKTDVATVTVTAPPPPTTVTITPASGALSSCQTLSFSATVANGTGGVTWSVQEGAAGGTITSAGVYTAPSSAGTYHVLATNAASGASQVATVTVTDKILSVSVSPTTSSVQTGGTAQFTATVTTTCGTFTSSTTVTP
jgi:hypothetical protein